MSGPHQEESIVTAGAALDEAEAGVVLVHGRGATAGSIIEMTEEFQQEGVAYLAPQAANNSWYPNSFLVEIESNEPGLSSGLNAIANAIVELTEAGIPKERIALLGFSQGACLASEFVARNATRYGGLAVLSGGLIGPEGTPREYEGSLDGTPVFLGCSDTDPHVPLERVHETAGVFEDLGADVTKRIYEGMGHGINEDELKHVSELIAGVVAGDD